MEGKVVLFFKFFQNYIMFYVMILIFDEKMFKYENIIIVVIEVIGVICKYFFWLVYMYYLKYFIYVL